MSSRAPHIRDFAAALADGTIPGRRAFWAQRPVFEFPAVESAGAGGARLVWTIRVAAREAGGRFVPLAPAWLRPGAQTPPGLVGVLATESFRVAPDGRRGKSRGGAVDTVVRRGKNLGKANATNPVTQALRDALGRYNARLRRSSGPGPGGGAPPPPRGGPGGGPPAAPRALEAPPPPERPPPMLVKKMGETRSATLTPATFAEGVTVQRKLNGVRVVAYLPGGRRRGAAVCLYSRTKGEYPGLAHIRAELAPLLAASPPVPAALLRPVEGCPAAAAAAPAAAAARLAALYAAAPVYLDGEIYLHGQSLRWISGQARRSADEETLDYVVFDCFFPAAKAGGHEMPSARRQEYLDLVFAARPPAGRGGGGRHVRRAENFRAASLAGLEGLYARFLREGYEGAIARKDCGGYRYGYNGYHSAALVKLKPLLDSEFELVGYTDGAGKDAGAVIWLCEVGPAAAKDAADTRFAVAPKGMSYRDRYLVFRCLGEVVANDPAAVAAGGPARLTRFERDFKGRPLTVEYPERSTKTGKPVQAKALAIRAYEGGPGFDPLRRLYAECGGR